MVTKEEIEHIVKLMRIDVDDPGQYFDRIQKILNYFDNLDKADIEDEEIMVQEVTVDELRDDIHVPFDSRLIDQLKNYKGRYIRAPKMN
ncbi:MAG: hypothetical protein QXE84_05310 [Candidatus Nitrosotenuis sp.]|uniref:Aspartyl/glutamyl-tRNA(Asn/Gln) amidotransferase subunit C n=1 Tax=Candidatus Nitrosotenuis uzonensis TaxID=1407055 RepID=A0A812F5D9_9ARCH|nr:hypothetical protein [Candidatus Nitrosotenuis uzonensis]MCA2003500.1 hypothetical protein [Candidatus Nitrosotenuis sp.]CAE6499214.1 conserved hypothetical protein [Candidatus Nitrosotenuis uzonensis]